MEVMCYREVSLIKSCVEGISKVHVVCRLSEMGMVILG